MKTTTSSSRFTLTGRHSRASYVLDTHYYLESTPECWGSYRAYAAPLYAPREETVCSFLLLPLHCFPDPRGPRPGAPAAFALSPSEFARKFWFVQRDGKNTFPSVYHRYVLHCIDDDDGGNGNGEEEGGGGGGAGPTRAHALAARGWQLLSTAGLRETLRQRWPEWLRRVEDRWTRDALDPRSALWTFRFDRLDACFERLGRRVLERIPWGHKGGWSLQSPLLECFAKESFLHYCVDRCLPHAEKSAYVRTDHLPAGLLASEKRRETVLEIFRGADRC